MRLFRRHWYQLGLAPALGLLLFLAFFHQHLSGLRILLCLSLITLFLHQFEEYRFPGTFPRMINTKMFGSDDPSRFPLNANTALLINVIEGWLLYTLAIVVAERAMWLTTAAVLISAGNVVAHTLLFNVKGRTFYNAGMATALLLFVPVVVAYFVYADQHHLLHPGSLAAGIALGVFLNYFGVLKMIGILADKDSPYPFIPLR